MKPLQGSRVLEDYNPKGLKEHNLKGKGVNFVKHLLCLGTMMIGLYIQSPSGVFMWQDFPKSHC